MNDVDVIIKNGTLLTMGPENDVIEDGLVAIGLPGDADGAVVLEHRFMVGASGARGAHRTRPVAQEPPSLIPLTLAAQASYSGGSRSHTSTSLASISPLLVTVMP